MWPVLHVRESGFQVLEEAEDDYEEKQGSHYGEGHAHWEGAGDAGVVEAASDVAGEYTSYTCMTGHPYNSN